MLLGSVDFVFVCKLFVIFSHEIVMKGVIMYLTIAEGHSSTTASFMFKDSFVVWKCPSKDVALVQYVNNSLQSRAWSMVEGSSLSPL